jgi:alpha-N-acetylglucosamine transferase
MRWCSILFVVGVVCVSLLLCFTQALKIDIHHCDLPELTEEEKHLWRSNKTSPKRTRYAHLTLANNNKNLVMALVLAHSLRVRGDRYDVVVMWSGERTVGKLRQVMRMFPAELGRRGVYLYLVDPLFFRGETHIAHSKAEVDHPSMAKLRGFQLDEYELINFLDADMVGKKERWRERETGERGKRERARAHARASSKQVNELKTLHASSRKQI